MKLQNKVAIITGSRRGIGKAIALEFAKQGCKVVIADVNIRDCKTLCDEIIIKGGKAIAVKCDVSNKKDVEAMFKKTIQKFGQLDIMVNNAGVLIEKPITQMTEKDWNFVLDINLKGNFLCSQAAAKIFLQQKKGKIISLSSIAGIIGFPGLTAYCASKAGIANMTKALAMELAPFVNVNAIAPGVIKTKMTEAMLQDSATKKQLLDNTILKRFGEPEDIAKAALYLASDDSNFVTGITLVVDGGWLAH